ncbi:MAG TPA: flavodoxin domain-containing protein [Acidimicrobiales bacterium]|nr:flavodoxin domain-containing protein [Acidimicrobiales bacterium]
MPDMDHLPAKGGTTVRVLVAYGSKRGGTAGIAETIADELRHQGLEVDLSPAHDARKPDGYDAVIIGGALYGNRWHHAASHFLRHNYAALRKRPTFLFSSGPLGQAFSGHNPPPVPEVRLLGARIEAREHVTFGGRLEPHPHGIMARLMAETLTGDWRDESEERTWARRIAAEVKGTHLIPT